MRDDFPMYLSFDLLNSNSNEPSRTIRINPMAPRNGKIGDKSGTTMEKMPDACLTTQPRKSKRITDGTFVLEDVISKTYAKSKRILIVMIAGIVMNLKLVFFLTGR